MWGSPAPHVLDVLQRVGESPLEDELVLNVQNVGEPVKQAACWACGSLDHLKRDCPNDRRIQPYPRNARFDIDNGFMGYFVCEDCGDERHCRMERSAGRDTYDRDPGQYPEDDEYYEDDCQDDYYQDDRYNCQDNPPKEKRRLRKGEQKSSQDNVQIVGVVIDDTLQEEPVLWHLETDSDSKDIANEDRIRM